MQRALAELTLEEGGFVLGAALARRGGDFVRAALAEPGASRCGEALDRLAGQAQPDRAASLAALMARARGPVPAGLDRVHPGWLRERLDVESSAVVREVTAELGPAMERLGEAILWERGEGAALPAPRLPAAGRAALQRIVFGGFVPLAGPGAPRGPVARQMLELDPDRLEDAIRRRGAEALGRSLQGADKGTLARTAAAVGPDLGAVVLEAAAGEGRREERDAARKLVGAVGRHPGSDVPFEVGLRSLATALAEEGAGAVLAVAQRMAVPTGRRLCAAAATGDAG